MAPSRLALLGLLLTGCLRPFDPLSLPDAASPPVMVDAAVPESPPPDLTFFPDLTEPISISFTSTDGPAIAGDGGASPGQVSGRAVFTQKVLPIMNQRCVSCHGAIGIGPPFMRPDPYDSLIAYQGIITRDPTHSLLVTKGPHNGPYFQSGELLLVLEWLSIEASSLPASLSSSVATPPQAAKTGPNTVSLDALGPDFLGASILFDATLLNGALKVTSLKVNASGPAGLHVVHPLFIGVDPKGVKHPDPVDSFDGYDFTLAHFEIKPIGAGLVLLTNIGQGDQISIAFQKIEKWTELQNGGKCKSLTSFTTNAAPLLSKTCFKCHSGMDPMYLAAKNALDMTKVQNVMSMSDQDLACAQVLNRITPKTPAQSQVFLVTNPANAGKVNHPFQFPDMASYNAFATPMTLWISAEQ